MTEPTYLYAATATTTADAYKMTGALLRITRDEGMFRVSDVLGLRYGHGDTLADALAEYAAQVDDLLTCEGPFAPRLAREIANYRRVFGAAKKGAA